MAYLVKLFKADIFKELISKLSVLSKTSSTCVITSRISDFISDANSFVTSLTYACISSVQSLQLLELLEIKKIYFNLWFFACQGLV